VVSHPKPWQTQRANLLDKKDYYRIEKLITVLRKSQEQDLTPFLLTPFLSSSSSGRLLDFALKRQHRNIIFLWGSADVGKKICTNPFHEFQCV
jgi:hypothetical protein